MLLVKNNAASTLLSAITGVSTELDLPSGHGARFPLPGAGEFFFITLQEGAAFEVVKCTERAGDQLTVVRAQDGTAAQSFGAGSSVTMRITAGVIETLQTSIVDAQEDADAAAAAAAAASAAAAAAAADAAAAVATRLPLTGGTLTGGLTLSYANATLSLRKQTIGENAMLAGYNGASLRWGVSVGDALTESGSNAGSNFAIYRYTDAGAVIDAPFYILRSSGRAFCNLGLSVIGTIDNLTGAYVGAGAVGRVNMIQGDATNPGFTEFRTPDNIRRGYIGWKVGSDNIGVIAENGWGLYFSGVATFNNTARFDSGVAAIRSGTNTPILELRRANNDFLGQIYCNNTNSLVFQLGSFSFRLTQDNLLNPPLRPTNHTDGLAPIEVDTGTTAEGDTALAAYSFHIPSRYRTKLKMRSDGVVGLGGNSASPWRWYVSMTSGDMVAAGNVFAYSDARLKESLERIDDPFAILGAITGYTFTWKADAGAVIGKPGTRDTGIIAQDAELVQHLIPGIVAESPTASFDDGSRAKLACYEKLVPVLVEAVKKLDARVKELESDVDRGF